MDLNLESLRTFFGWCTLINIGLLTLNTVGIFFLRGVAERLHSKLFGLEPAFIRRSMYRYLMLHKIGLLLFNLVPWLALVVMTR